MTLILEPYFQDTQTRILLMYIILHWMDIYLYASIFRSLHIINSVGQ